MTLLTYRYINRGLYEKDKTSFKLIVTFKILLTASNLDMKFINLFLRDGSAMDITQSRPKPFNWMSNEAWLNILALSASSNESVFIQRYYENEPEKFPIPMIEARFFSR